MQPIRYFSLFSGIGGFEFGISQAFGNNRAFRTSLSSNTYIPSQRYRTMLAMRNSPICVGYSEINAYAERVYKRHFPKHKNWGDITKINASALPDFDLLCGGFPCQAFSIAGKHGGFNDNRGKLFFDIARIIKQKQPRLILLENVKGLLSHNKGNTALTIFTILNELGYDCQWQVLNSKNFGVPQNRERVFIVGHLRGTSRPKVFPLTATTKKEVSNYYPKLSNCFATPRIRKLTPIECERLQGFPDEWTKGLSNTQRQICLANSVTTYVIRDIIKAMLAC